MSKPAKAPARTLAVITAEADAARKLLAEKQAEFLEAKKVIREQAFNQISTLPAQFGVETTSEVIDLIRDYNRSMLGQDGATTVGRKIAPEVKAKAMAMLKAENPEPISKIALAVGVSAPTLNNWKKEAGLTKTRAPATA